MLGICPDATLVDISHDMPPHDVLAGALELAAAYRYFPPARSFSSSSIPGVGSTRRGDRRRSRRLPVRRARQRRADARSLDEHPPKRDRRAERAAVRAADGQPHVRGARSLRAGGRVAGERHRPRRARPPRRPDCTASRCRSRVDRPGTDRGEVLRVDRFGNLITNIDRRTFDASGARRRGRRSTSARAPVPERGRRPTPTRPPARSARSSAAPTISRLPPTARAPPRCSIWRGARAPCA